MYRGILLQSLFNPSTYFLGQFFAALPIKRRMEFIWIRISSAYAGDHACVPKVLGETAAHSTPACRHDLGRGRMREYALYEFNDESIMLGGFRPPADDPPKPWRRRVWFWGTMGLPVGLHFQVLFSEHDPWQDAEEN
jgi:hypothetical protein